MTFIALFGQDFQQGSIRGHCQGTQFHVCFSKLGKNPHKNIEKFMQVGSVNPIGYPVTSREIS